MAICNHTQALVRCHKDGDEVYDYYGIFAGYWCDEHRSEAPGQFPYAGADTEPLEEEGY